MKLTGRIYVRVNGELLLSQEGAKLGNITGVERTAVVGNDVHGYTEKAVVPFIEVPITHTVETKLMEMAKIDEASITFECDSGKVYVLRQAWLANALELEAGGKPVSLRFEGKKVEEVA